MEASLIDKINVQSNFRFERKFTVATLSIPQVEAVLKSNRLFFKEIFKARRINNIYFDTPNLDFYRQNKNGTMNRKKVRIRWYGETFRKADNPILEIKFKNNQVGHKWSFPLKSFDLSQGLTRGELKDVMLGSDIPGAWLDLTSRLRPTLLNSYKRKYFQSADQQFRITIDSCVSYKNLNYNFTAVTRKMVVRSQEAIIELKYNLESDSIAGRLVNQFPFRLSKSCKYCDGIDLLTATF